MVPFGFEMLAPGVRVAAIWTFAMAALGAFGMLVTLPFTHSPWIFVWMIPWGVGLCVLSFRSFQDRGQC